jgi:hypothetical protein
VFASDEKAAWNCLFKILAFSVGSACKTPSLLRGVILLFSFFPAFYIGVYIFGLFIELLLVPWVTPQIKKLINKKNKLFKNKNLKQ